MFEFGLEEDISLNPGFELGSARVYLDADGGGLESSTSHYGQVCFCGYMKGVLQWGLLFWCEFLVQLVRSLP